MSDMAAPRPIIPALGGIYAALEPYSLPLLRLVMGLILMPHGCQKLFGWFGGAGFEKFTQFFTQFGYKPAAFWVAVVALTELVGGALLAIGFLTRFAALAILIFMINAVIFTSAKGFFWTTGGLEYSLLIGGRRAGVPDPRRRQPFRRPRAWQRTLRSRRGRRRRLATGRCTVTAIAARATRMRARAFAIPSLSSARARSGSRRRSILACAACRSCVLDDFDRIGEGSRGICWSKRTLEILDRLGVGERLVAQGVTWKLGKVFRGDDLVFAFDLLPEDGHKMPAFINLQQFYLEKALVDRALEIDRIDLRWKNRATGLERLNDGVRLTIETPDGPYAIEADWLIAADGARSTMRDLMGLGFSGVTFEDKFLIADVRMAADFPTERRFWFAPTFHSGQSALMHRQPDNVWRIDLQLGPDADAALEQQPERVMARLRKVLGERPFELIWVSLYTFNCRRLDRFDARSGDFRRRCRASGLAVRRARRQFRHPGRREPGLEARCGAAQGRAARACSPATMLERMQAADENIGHSTRSTDFIAPHTAAERRLRDAVLALAPKAEFARRMVNSGRLSVPTIYESPLSTRGHGAVRRLRQARQPGAGCAAAHAGRRATHLLERLRGDFAVLHVKDGARPNPPAGMSLIVIGEDLIDHAGLFAQSLRCHAGRNLPVAARSAPVRALAGVRCRQGRCGACPRAGAITGLQQQGARCRSSSPPPNSPIPTPPTWRWSTRAGTCPTPTPPRSIQGSFSSSPTTSAISTCSTRPSRWRGKARSGGGER